MAVHFHPLIVKEVKRETPDCVSVIFDIPVDLQKVFLYTQGQNVTLKTNIDGEEIRRSYSICSAPFENELRIAVKRVEGGKFSSYVNYKLKENDVLEVMPPTGKFNTTLLKENKKNYVAFAAGSGITPIISLIKATLKIEPQSSFTLVYSNRSRGAIIFFEELEGLKNKFLERFNFIHILSREKTEVPINYGRIDAEKLLQLSSIINYNSTDDFFICGPHEMIFCVKDFLEERKIASSKIHFELFTRPGQKIVLPENKIILNNNLPKSKVTVKLDGRSVAFELSFDSDSILDAALKQGADLPFACKGGVCATCRAKLVAGKVTMKVNYALEPEEVAQGFILTCQSHPVTENVVIDFDVK